MDFDKLKINFSEFLGKASAIVLDLVLSKTVLILLLTVMIIKAWFWYLHKHYEKNKDIDPEEFPPTGITIIDEVMSPIMGLFEKHGLATVHAAKDFNKWVVILSVTLCFSVFFHAEDWNKFWGKGTSFVVIGLVIMSLHYGLMGLFGGVALLDQIGTEELKETEDPGGDFIYIIVHQIFVFSPIIIMFVVAGIINLILS